MPQYHYFCYKCQKKFWIEQPITDPTLKYHEGCGGKVTRHIQPVNIQFKGSGFYITDNKPQKTTD